MMRKIEKTENAWDVIRGLNFKTQADLGSCAVCGQMTIQCFIIVDTSTIFEMTEVIAQIVSACDVCDVYFWPKPGEVVYKMRDEESETFIIMNS